MKKILIVLIIFICVNAFAQDIGDLYGLDSAPNASIKEFGSDMPDKIKNSILILRNGVNDLPGITVGNFFLNNDFKTKIIEGTPSTLKENHSMLSGDTYYLSYILVENGVNILEITCKLEFQGIATKLDVICIDNLQTDTVQYFMTLDDKVAFVKLLMFYSVE